MVLIVATLSSLGPAAAREGDAPSGGGAWFADVSPAAGITLPVQNQHMPGQAWADYDRDGFVDLYLTGGVNPSVLYRNNGDGSFSVAPVSDQVALPGSSTGGAVFGDYDNDGWPDLYVLVNSEAAGEANTLFHNDSGQGFSDVTGVANVGDLGVGTTGSWGDYDGDGFIDLYVANWFCATCPNGTRDTLYHNDGDGTFTDVSALLGADSPMGPGFVASFLDYDNDGDLDIYLVNDKNFSGSGIPPYRNVLWRNDGAGCGGWCFSDVSEAAGADAAVDGMGLAVGDYDNDGDLDMYFSNGGPQVLLANQTSQGSATFIDVSSAAGVDFAAIGWGCVFADFDDDGWPDLYLATSNTQPSFSNRLFANLGDGTFADVSTASGASNGGQTLGVASADYDGDGRVDLVIGNLGESYTLYRNLGSVGAGNHWLAFDLVGGGSVNRDAIGSRLWVSTDDGRTLMAEVKSGSSLGSGNDLALHFGLGSAAVEQAVVRWPDGRVEVFPDIAVDRAWTIVYPRGLVLFSDGFEAGNLVAWSAAAP